MTHHRVKAHPAAFEGYARGVKPFSLRVNDRQYQPGDTFEVYEWAEGEATGREAGPWRILSVWRGLGMLPPEWVALGLGNLEVSDGR